jgi:acyl transferase domain-containing protein/3-hydroxymyristoyl/3-hydroxydecanoyl-(acyl carrier protein) dehydratase
MPFSPIAIVGRACVLPGALSPAALWQVVASGRDLLSTAPAGRWGVPQSRALSDSQAPDPDRSWSDRGGYVEGFETVWNPRGFRIDAAELDGLDPLFHWVLHCAREALQEANGANSRAGAVFGNLGFPSAGMAAFAHGVWTGSGQGDARNRFQSGGCAALLQRALGLEAGSFCIDAACASSLYAIKLACDRLQCGEADLMLAGAVQRADDLFLHVGFSALNALSRSGRSRPFHRDADGLVPAEGAAFLALKRLGDARRDGDTVHGVIRGIGLSNDGRGKGFLAPAESGQRRALALAYAAANIDPIQVSLLECHATGTPVGDATELASSAAQFADCRELPIGSLKSNLGHLITTAGAAALIKVLEAMRAGQRPPTLHADAPTAALEGTPFRLLQSLEDWPSEGPRIAGISAFGFGGNNAHLIVSEDDERLSIEPASARPQKIALVGLGCRIAATADRTAFAAALFSAADLRDANDEGRMSTLRLDLDGLRFPPRDLARALPQQLALLEAAREAIAETSQVNAERCGIFIGMEPDAEVARYGTRWRLPALPGQDPAITAVARDAIVPALDSAAVIGCMPNIPANRLSAQFDLGGPAFTVQGGRDSAAWALRIAAHALGEGEGEIDAALVGAVDFGCEAVNRAATDSAPADAAVVLVAKRLEDAEAAGDRVYAVFDGNAQVGSATTGTLDISLGERIGDAGAAASGVDLAAASLALHQRRRPDAAPWLSATARRVRIPFAGGALWLDEAQAQHACSESPRLRLHGYAGANRDEVIAALRADRRGLDGPARLVLVADEVGLPALRERALAHLIEGVPAGNTIHFREQPIVGELAFAFAGAGAAYPDMGRELLLQLPQLTNRLAARSPRLATALAGWWAARQPDAETQLWAASALSQLHLEFSRGVLGLQPDAWLGYSSGETNALFGAGIWQHADALIEATEHSAIMRREIGGEFAAVSRHWGRPAHWACWTVAASPDAVRAALHGLHDVHLAIINSDADCMIAGDAEGCAQAVARLGAARCQPLDYTLAVHVPELANVAEEWLQLHRLPVTPLLHGRIYSSSRAAAYPPSEEACARAILDQATQTLDIRPLVRAAWDDGVRVFVEHGPGGAFARAIRSALGEREALVVSLDRRGQGIAATLGAVAALIAAGVPIDLDALAAAMPEAVQRPPAKRPLQLAAHPPSLDLSAVEAAVALPSATPAIRLPLDADLQHMPPAPALPSVFAEQLASVAGSAVASMPVAPRPIALPSLAADTPLHAAVAHLGQLAVMQQAFVAGQAQVQQRFLALRGAALQVLLARTGSDAAMPHGCTPLPPVGEVAPKARVAPGACLDAPPLGSLREIKGCGESAPGLVSDESGGASSALEKLSRSAASTPLFTREQLEVHAGGRISEVFGPDFAFQDGFARQVRMPMPPLLLADRVMSLDAEPLSMGKGSIVTETDVAADAWYLHRGRMPAGVMIEAGQADLMLISWLGVDRFNRGERVYRLLGCELTYHGELPRRGETLRFDIHLDGHAAQDEVRLMFFHYDCVNGDRPQLSVRGGQAGFFTAAELAASAGCLWTAETQTIVDTPRLDPPAVVCTRSTFDAAALDAFAAGDAHACFGAGFERALSHTRTPAIAGGRMRLFDRVTEVSARGGPWARGYLRAELDIRPDHWFFAGHFKNDPCMPGTLMFEACLEAMAFQLAWQGYTISRDGWRFQPVPELPFKLQCRGQVLPTSKRLVTEVFVEEVVAGPIPTLYADLLCTVDGLKAFHARRVALQLVPDWPLEDATDALALAAADTRPVAEVEGFRFDQRSILATALGRPSEAFGPRFARFDSPMPMPRLPGPPYLFITRIADISGPIGEMRAGARVVAEYDLPAAAWYFEHNGCARMPYAVLLEAALQPCGWLASYVGSALGVDEALSFRNLDGEGELLAELTPGAGTLRTEVELTDVSATAGMIIQTFAVNCTLDGRPVYRLRTVFGFFPPAALAAQVGLPTSAAQREPFERVSEVSVELDALLGADRPRLPQGMLRIIDRLDGVWPQAGKAGLGQLRTVKAVDPGEWFFKAHFFQDPVQPGSLGLEAMAQGLQAWALHTGLDLGLRRPRLQSLALAQRHRWKYRGQVVPEHRQVHTTLEITAVEREADGCLLVADGSLWVDGRRIYEASGLGVRLLESDGER